MANFQKIQLTRSSVAGSVPLASELDEGELALNFADKKLFFKNSSGTVEDILGISNVSSGLITTSSGTSGNTTGLVGIGVSDPKEKLHVAGTIRIEGSVGQFNASLEDSDLLSRKEYIQFDRIDSSDSSAGTDGARIYSDATSSNTDVGDLVLSLSDNTSAGSQSFIVRNENGASSGGEGVGYKDLAVFQAGGANSVEVGIGTSTPQSGYELTIHDSAGQSKMLLRSDSSTFGAIDFGDESDNDIGSIIYDHTNNSMRFDTADAEAIRIDSSQRVGIGTSSPEALLHIKGTDGSGTIKALIENGAGGQAGVDIKNSEGHFRLITDTGAFRVYDQGDGADRIAIDTNGNFGIGTTTPGIKLEVAGQAQVEGYLRLTQTTGNQRLVLGNQNSTGADNPAIIQAANGQLFFGNGSSWTGDGGTFTEVMGIGTTHASTAAVPTSGNHITNKTYVDANFSPNIVQAVNQASTRSSSAPVVGTFIDYPSLFVTITPVFDGSKFLISGDAHMGAYTTGHDYVSKYTYKKNEAGVDDSSASFLDFLLPTSPGSRVAGHGVHFSYSDRHDDIGNVKPATLLMTPVSYSVSAGDSFTFKIQVASLLANSSARHYFNNSESTENNANFCRTVSQITVQEIRQVS